MRAVPLPPYAGRHHLPVTKLAENLTLGSQPSSCIVQGMHARCGSLLVAEIPAAPHGRKISLRAVLLPATTSDRAPDPLFYLTGGPGGAATDVTAWVAQRFEPLNLNHDIVLIDQRGTGGSNHVTCSSAALAGVSTEAQGLGTRVTPECSPTALLRLQSCTRARALVPGVTRS
jgi:hypothetical protein